MRVIATAGHVNHGKSTLVRALTGMEPDRWVEERRRGMTIDLGFAWTRLGADAEDVISFVDVPGHHRFVSNMLAGVGPVPAVLLVIAADEGWRQQTSEHMQAILALGIRQLLLAVTRSDLADPRPAIAEGQERLKRLGIGDVPAVAVSPPRGIGIGALRAALARLLSGLPQPAVEGAPIRLWIDRSFTIRGSGTVVTGTLGAGRLSVGDTLELNGRAVKIRGLQQLGSAVSTAEAVGRIAVNLRGVDVESVHRGQCLLTPGSWPLVGEVDAELDPQFAEAGSELMVYLGSAAVPARCRALGSHTVRLSLSRPLPLRAGDRLVLRDPGQQAVTAGAQILDADPPRLSRRGSARRRGLALADRSAIDPVEQVRRRGVASGSRLAALGVTGLESADVLRTGDWLVDRDHWAALTRRLLDELTEQERRQPSRPWLAQETARQLTGLPTSDLVDRLVADSGLRTINGRIQRPGVEASLGAAEPRMAVVLGRLAADPFDAPERPELAELGLGVRELATAARMGLLTRLAPDLVVGVDAPVRGMQLLRNLPQPFTASQARQAFSTTRRVALPLLEYLDGLGWTRRTNGSERVVVTDLSSAGTVRPMLVRRAGSTADDSTV
jgi:selenocysteine-specific elongation factor